MESTTKISTTIRTMLEGVAIERGSRHGYRSVVAEVFLAPAWQADGIALRGTTTSADAAFLADLALGGGKAEQLLLPCPRPEQGGSGLTGVFSGKPVARVRTQAMNGHDELAPYSWRPPV